MSEPLDVAVIGATPAGLDIARLLAAQGQRVMIFDAARCVCTDLEDIARRHALVLALDEPVSELRWTRDGVTLLTAYAAYRAKAVVMTPHAPLRCAAQS